MENKYIIRLNDAEREQLRQIVKQFRAIQRFQPEGSARTDFAQGRCPWCCVDGLPYH